MSLLMWITIHCKQNTFTGSEFLNFTIYEKKMLEMFLEVKGKNNNSPCGI